jgi:hypothetical protein
MGDLVGGHSRRTGAIGSAALEQAMHQIQDGEGQPTDRRRAQWLALRPIRPSAPHPVMIHQLRVGV